MRIVWQRLPGNWLMAQCQYSQGAGTTGLRDTDMDPVQDWCVANKCGIRTSFDTFRFQNEEELAFFLLKWT